MSEHILTEYQFCKKLRALPYIDEIWLYGSRARGDHRDRSDIDLAVLCPSATDREWLTILDIIDEADTLLKIDCVRFDHLSPSNPLRQMILRDKKILWRREE